LVQFTVIIQKFAEQGEKTGWTYIEVPAAIAQQLKPGQKRSFRVKGKLDDYKVSGLALIPAGNGDFIIALNAETRKAIRKRKGDPLKVIFEPDNRSVQLSAELMDCLSDEPKALQFFKSLAPSHQQYYSKWIQSAKTELTKTKRIAQTINSLSKGYHFGQMLRAIKEEKDFPLK